MQEYDGTDGSGSSGVGCEQGADMGVELRVCEDSKEFLSGWGEGFSHFVTVFLNLFCLFIRGEKFFGMGEVLFWFPQVLGGGVVLPLNKELMSLSRVLVCDDCFYLIFGFSLYRPGGGSRKFAPWMLFSL